MNVRMHTHRGRLIGQAIERQRVRMTTAAAALSMVLTAARVAWTMKNDVHCGGAAAAAAMQVAWPTEASCQGGWGEAGGGAVRWSW